MSISRFRVVCFALLIFGLGCQSNNRLAGTDPKPLPFPEDTVEIRNLDTMVVTPGEELALEEVPNELPVYHPTNTREWDLIHTVLDLRFDWERQAVLGKAELTLTPYFYPSETLILDAKGFEFNGIKDTDNEADYAYEYDGSQIIISLQQSYSRNDTINIEIDYTAFPSEGSDGSAAITSDQGLFFINPDGSEAPKPQQIWTQGETTFNSRWFPTIDSPNERTTQEVYLTVKDTFETLSNGLLMSSTPAEDGMRTDHWVLDQPHAPYLFAIVVGDFAVVEDKWKEVPLQYVVEHEYEEDADLIFEHTPEMLTFFSKITGMEYPWDKYSQVVVRDYVSGAMENTTCVIFGEFVQKHKRELIDDDNDYIVAHELIHHWFGDYVTCESWSNLVLNEGFANYGEYLWMEHNDGVERAEHHRLEEFQGYLYQANQEIHPLVYFGYDDKEDMFDQHSYNKGGLVLHMLRKLVGDDAFFAALNKYLVDNALSAVEVHDLRLAFEATTGLDLNWFFNQWYLSPGHPVIEFDWSWDADNSELVLQTEQTQDPMTNPPIFVLPTEVDVYHKDGSKIRIPVEIDQRSFEHRIAMGEEPDLVVLDPDRTQLAIIMDDLSTEDYALLYKNPNSLILRFEAASQLAGETGSMSESAMISALDDPFWEIRRTAIQSLDWQDHPELHDRLVTMASDDRHSLVRADAIYALTELEDDSYNDILANGINDYDAYPVVAASIRALNETNPEMAEEKIKVLESENQSDIVAALSSIYAESADTANLAYFDKHLDNLDGLQAIDFYTNLEILLDETSSGTIMNWLEKCESVATQTSVTPYNRIAATRMIVSYVKKNQSGKGMLSQEQVSTLEGMLDRIIETEQNSQVKNIYRSFMS